jgi:hypothetical protein
LLPADGLFVPAGQGVHAVWPVAFANDPAAQAAHDVCEAAPAAVPAGHAWQSAPAVGLKLPAAHAVQADAPAALDVPAAQTAQAADPPLAEYDPAPHVWHVVAPDSDAVDVPGGQGTQEVRPVAFE